MRERTSDVQRSATARSGRGREGGREGGRWERKEEADTLTRRVYNHHHSDIVRSTPDGRRLVDKTWVHLHAKLSDITLMIWTIRGMLGEVSSSLLYISIGHAPSSTRITPDWAIPDWIELPRPTTAGDGAQWSMRVQKTSSGCRRRGASAEECERGAGSPGEKQEGRPQRSKRGRQRSMRGRKPEATSKGSTDMDGSSREPRDDDKPSCSGCQVGHRRHAANQKTLHPPDSAPQRGEKRPFGLLASSAVYGYYRRLCLAMLRQESCSETRVMLSDQESCSQRPTVMLPDQQS